MFPYKQASMILQFLLYFGLLFILPSTTKSQELTSSEKKVFLIFKFAENIEWTDEEQIDSFRIGVISDDEMFVNDLRIFETVKLKGRVITIQRFYSVSEIENVHTLIITDDRNYLIDRIAEKIQGSQTLLISDGNKNQDQIMINFTYSKNKQLDFEVNRANILREKMKIKPELLLLGGSEVDIAGLYKESQESLLKIKKEVALLDKKSRDQASELQRRNLEIENKTKEISQRNIEISQQKNELVSLNDRIAEQDNTLEQDLIRFEALRKQFDKQLSEIDSTKEYLSELNKEIDSKQNRIENQEKKIISYESVLTQQKTIIYLFTSLLAMVLIVVVIIYRGLVIKKKTARKLAQKEAEIRMLFDIAPVPVVMTELDSGKAIYINQLGLDLFRLDSEQALKYISSRNYYVIPEQRDRMVESLKKEGRVNNQEVQLKDSMGNEFYGSVSGLITQYENMTVLFLAIKDITDIKNAVTELQKYKNHLEDLVKERSQKLVESQNRFKDLAELLPETIFEMDMEGEISFVNKRGLEMFRIDTTDLAAGLNIFEVIEKADHGDASKGLEKLRKEKKLQTDEFQFQRKDSTYFPGIIYMNSTQTNNNTEIVRGIIVDITERKNLEREILNTMIQTEEKERKRFAEDLHDGLGSLLSSLNLYVDMIDNPSLPEDERVKLFSTIRKIIDDSINNSKEISNNLRPSTLSRFGLTGSLQSFCDKINDTGKIKIEFDYSELNTKLNANIENALYRIVNELINNTLKYASASKAVLELKSRSSAVSLYYNDNGIGFDKQKALDSEGMGLKNILTRVKSINGTCDIKSKEGEGFEVSITVKVSNKHNMK